MGTTFLLNAPFFIRVFALWLEKNVTFYPPLPGYTLWLRETLSLFKPSTRPRGLGSFLCTGEFLSYLFKDLRCKLTSFTTGMKLRHLIHTFNIMEAKARWPESSFTLFWGYHWSGGILSFLEGIHFFHDVWIPEQETYHMSYVFSTPLLLVSVEVSRAFLSAFKCSLLSRRLGRPLSWPTVSSSYCSHHIFLRIFHLLYETPDSWDIRVKAFHLFCLHHPHIHPAKRLAHNEYLVIITL